MEEYARYSFEAKPISTYLQGNLKNFFRNIILSCVGHIPFNSKEKALRCIYFHWVFDDNVAHFERIINELHIRGDFVNIERCRSMLEGKEPINGTYYHLSFDDWFKNNLVNAATILRKLNVPACFFVPTGCIGSSYNQVYRQLVTTKRYRKPIEMLSWDDCKQLLDWGFDVGSHTRTHARLSEISSDDNILEKEIRGSKEDLENRLGYECKYISWPYGSREDVNEKVIVRIKEVGYQACFGAFRGKITNDSRPSRFMIPRHNLEADWPLSHIFAFISGALGG